MAEESVKEQTVKITVAVPKKVIEDLREVDRFLEANGFAHSTTRKGVTEAARKVLESGAKVFLGHIAEAEVDTLIKSLGGDTLLALRFTKDELNALQTFAILIKARRNKVDPGSCDKVSKLDAIKTAMRNGIAAIKQLIEQEKPQEGSPPKAKV